MRWAAKKKNNLIPLPDGVTIGEVPELFDLHRKGRGTGDKWIAYVQRLMTMPATQALKFDLANVGDTKKHTRAVINGIRRTGEMMKWHKKVKYAMLGQVLYVTT